MMQTEAYVRALEQVAQAAWTLTRHHDAEFPPVLRAQVQALREAVKGAEGGLRWGMGGENA